MTFLRPSNGTNTIYTQDNYILKGITLESYEHTYKCPFVNQMYVYNL